MNTLPHPVPRIFISHSSMDDAFGHRITQDLRREFDDDTVVWYDSQGSLRGGDTWLRKIERGITECDVFVVVLSPSAMESLWVNNEIDMALTQRKQIIPLHYKACSVRPSLQPIQAISFLPPHTYETGFNELCAVLGITGPALVSSSSSKDTPWWRDIVVLALIGVSIISVLGSILHILGKVPLLLEYITTIIGILIALTVAIWKIPRKALSGQWQKKGKERLIISGVSLVFIITSIPLLVLAQVLSLRQSIGQGLASTPSIGSSPGLSATDTVISTATSTFSPTVSSSPLAGWHKIFSQLAPTCGNQNGIGWTKGSGDFACRPEGLAMQQTSETFAELDLTQVNGNAFNLTTFGVKVTASFQDPTDPFTYASLFVQIPRTADGIGGYVFDLSTYGGRGWDLYQVKSAKTVQGLDSSSAVHGALGASNGPITMIAIVQNGEFSVYINNQSEPLFRQHLTFNPSPGNFGLMAWKFGSTSSSIVYFSNFELYEPK